MPLQDRLCFVQFMHPGAEASAGSDGIMPWNTGSHKRKFLEVPGRCRRNAKDYEGPLRFWAEWEPESRVVQKIAGPDRVPFGPKRVCEPFYTVREFHVGDKLQNTDPFVFGGFFYTLCQQYKRINGSNEFHAMQLTRLARGSVILFGSCLGRKFVLDTVFVVDRWEDHDGADYQMLKKRVPKGYWDVTLAAWYKDSVGGCSGTAQTGGLLPIHENRYRLYWGATVDRPVEGMFSFFPCQPAHLSSRGFARPVIELPGTISNQQTTGHKLNSGLTMAQVRRNWKRVCQQVEKAGLWIGTSSQMPRRQTTPF
jgi:hypothetical protein